MALYKIIDGIEFDLTGSNVSRHIFFDKLGDAEEYAQKVFAKTREIVCIEKTDEEFVKNYFDRIGTPMENYVENMKIDILT